jgi:DNA-binding CsgD family transcriptional regulator
VIVGLLDKVTEGREAYRRRAWSHAYQALTLADQDTPLGIEDLERLATSAYLAGRDHEFHRALERAHHAHRKAGDDAGAARSAFWLGLTLLLRGETGQASGWLGRARRLVESRACVEHGYLLLPVAEQSLAGGDGAAAHATAASAADIGDRFGDADLVACARHLQGRALIRQGQVQAGLALLDEAMLSVVAGELSPIVTGLIYCSVIDACQQVVAWSRAREWTSALARWCDQQPEMVAFTGTCLVHRAEILEFHGAWSDAMAEACRACERFSEVEPMSAAAAFYRRAEIHRRRGEFAAAEQAYRDAGRLGWEPQPGLALLRMVQGRIDAACAAIRRVLSAVADPLQRAKLVPAYVEIMLAAGAIPDARSACRELEGIAATFETDVLQAMAAHARGAVELADGDGRAALGPLRRAFEVWRKAEAPWEAARARMLAGLACRALGDDEAAELELAAARAAFERLGAAPEIARLDALVRRPMAAAPRHGLTRREREVLRLIAAGKTNKAIAAELRLSERTIDRHVSNILTKLDVPSRAAATAYAYGHKLL